jgi:uncharacterized lipoprotein YajG
MKNVMFALVAVAMLASCAEATTEETMVEETVVDTTVVVEEPVEGGSEVAKPEEVEAIAE